MYILKKVKKLWTKAMQTVYSLTGQGGQFSLMGQDFRFGTQSKDFLLEAYGMNPYVFMVVDRICQRFVQIDKRLLDKAQKEIDNPEFRQLLENPNHKEDGSSFLYRASATFLTTGECFIVRSQQVGEPDQYFVPINYNVTINQDTRGNVLGYTITSFGEATAHFRHDVLHISKPDITRDTNHGFSTNRATRKVWESNSEVWNSEASLHRNKGITGVLFSDGSRPMTNPEQEQLQNQYDADHTGVTNFGKVKVSTAKLGYVKMGMNPSDLKSIETRIEHLRTICASYNVDSKLFGDSASSTYNNMAEAQRAFIINAVIPLSKLLLPKIIEFMSVSVFQSYGMVLNEETIIELQLTKDQKSARIGREVIQGILTPDQAREILYPELVDTEGEGTPATGDSLEQNSAAEAANVEAQAGLRGSVGGVQGILSIQAGVEAGTTSRESAIVILMQIYGFDEQTAENILGEQSNEG